MLHHSLYLSKSSKIYRCWIVWGRNTRVVIVPSFLTITFLGQSNLESIFHSLWKLADLKFAISTSYLVNRFHPKVFWTAWRSYLEFRIGFDWYSRVYGCECSCDGFNRVQDLQGLPTSQGQHGRANFGRHWREQTLLCHIYNNRIWDGSVFDPTRSVRVWLVADKRCR